MCSFRNDRNGAVINTDLTKAQVAAAFAEVDPKGGEWLWYWMARYVQEAKQVAAEAPKALDMIAFIADSFTLAVGMGLKNPMIRLHYKNKRYKIYLSSRGTVCIKTGALVPGTQDPQGDEVYMGCILPSGKFLTPSASSYGPARPLQPAEVEFMDRLRNDPVAFMAECSKDMSRCCYCYSALEDARSKDVGYGPVCAVRWGLPWGKGYNEAVPSFAELWQRQGGDSRRNIRAVCDAIRQNPRDAMAWAMLGDLMEEAGYTKRPEMPKEGQKMARA